jgi:hypothetical protein
MNANSGENFSTRSAQRAVDAESAKAFRVGLDRWAGLNHFGFGSGGCGVVKSPVHVRNDRGGPSGPALPRTFAACALKTLRELRVDD